jgi:hypothetical protein
MIYRTEQTVPRPGYLGAGNWTLSKLTDVTVLMGKNGAGKSLLLRQWRDLNPDQLHYVVPERTGDFNYDPNSLQAEFGGLGRKGSSAGNFTQEYRRRIIARVQTYFMKRGNARSESVAPANPKEIEDLLGLLVPDFLVQLRADTPPFAFTRLSNNEPVSDVNQLSSGEAQIITLSLDILTIAAIWEIEERAERIVLVDEPDPHVHPDLQARFADFLIRAADRFKLQFVVATHSTSLMSALGQFGADRASVIYLHRTQTDYVAQVFDDVTKQVASCLGGHVLMGALFGAPLWLVEGDDDYRIWSQVPRHNVVDVAVLPCNGEEIKTYQRKLETILASLCDKRALPIGYALLDKDKGLPKPQPDNPQDFVKFIQLNCHESENLYLTDVVLNDLGHTWDSAKKALLEAAPKFGKKQQPLEECTKFDRRTGDFKAVIDQIAQIIDSKGVFWTLRVGNAIGRERPAGDLADYLGIEVINALWGPPLS